VVLFTTKVTAVELLELKVALPLYAATIVWEPPDRLLVVKSAVPFRSWTVARGDPLSMKVTVPETGPAPVTGVTTALRVTVWPRLAGLGLTERLVDVG